MKQANQDRGTLLLALVAGLSINGTFAALFGSIVPFSVFPIISLVLTVYCLHQRYLNRTMPVGLPGLAAAALTSSRQYSPSLWCSGLARRCVTVSRKLLSNRYYAGCWRIRHGFYFAVSNTPHSIWCVKGN